MHKDKLEKSFREAGTAPMLREKMGNYDLFIADGFSNPPHLSYQRFGIEPNEFPAGMYVTFWFLGKDEHLHIGRPMFFHIDEFKLERRLNAARKDAKQALKKLRKH